MIHKKSSYQTGKLAKRRRRIFILRIVLWSVFVVALIGGMAFWSHAENLTVSNIEIEESTFTKPVEIKSIVQSHLEGKYLFGFARDNALLIPKGDIEAALIEKYPSVESVSLKLKGMDTLIVSFSEYEPVAKWCADAGDNDCYFINNKGIVFLEESSVNAYDLITFKNIITEDPIGKEYVSAVFVNDIVKFNNEIGKINLKIKKVSSEDAESFTLMTAEGIELYIDKSDDLGELLENLLIVIDQEAIHKAQLRNIDYIDLRFGNKVIYKLKEWK